MRLRSGWTAVTCLLLMALCTCTAHAAGKGSVSGTLRHANGQPAVGVTVRLEQDIPIPANPPGEGRPGSGQRQPRKKIVAQATTDKDGKFTVAGIEPGAYRIVAGNRNIGWIYMDVEVKPDEEMKLGETKLVKPT